jgi:hypothetical protein
MLHEGIQIASTITHKRRLRYRAKAATSGLLFAVFAKDGSALRWLFSIASISYPGNPKTHPLEKQGWGTRRRPVYRHIVAKDVIHISEAEAATTNVATLLAHVRTGAEVVIENDAGLWRCCGLQSLIRAACSPNPPHWRKPMALPQRSTAISARPRRNHQ